MRISDWSSRRVLFRARIRRHPRDDLDAEHRGIDDQREPQYPPPLGVVQRGLAAFAGTALIGHRQKSPVIFESAPYMHPVATTGSSDEEDRKSTRLNSST